MKVKGLRSAFLALAGFLLGVGPGTARAANILVVAGTDSTCQAAAARLNADLSGTNTVTVVNTGAPGSLAGYTQIYDVRGDDLPATTAAEENAYLDFLKAAPGNVLFLMGENVNQMFATRNQAICDFIALAGGGTIARPASTTFAAETVDPAFGSAPNALTTVTFAAAGLVTSSGNGRFATSEAGGGGSLYFNQGTLANAPTGALVVVFDVNFMATAPTGYGAANETPFRQNLEAFVSVGGNLGSVPALAASANPASPLSPVTFTATIAGGTDGIPVSFLDGTTLLGTAALASGTASFTTSTLASGTHTIRASYVTASNITLNSLPLTEVVNAYATPSVSASANPAPVFSAVTFTAAIPGGADGTVVTFLDGTTQLGTGALASGAATFTTSGLAVGTHTITAAYAPGGTTITSAALSMVVSTSPTTLALTSSGPSRLGDPVTFTATVAGAGSPTGSIQFLQDSTPLGTADLDSHGVAVFTIATLPAGTDAISASYAGDGNHAAATSNVLNQVVDPTPVIFFPDLPAASLPVTAGSAATTTFTLASRGVLAAPVLLTVTGLPPGAACEFSASAVDVSGGPVTVRATFNTTPRLVIIGRTRGSDPLGGTGTAALLGCGILALDRIPAAPAAGDLPPGAGRAPAWRNGRLQQPQRLPRRHRRRRRRHPARHLPHHHRRQFPGGHPGHRHRPVDRQLSQDPTMRIRSHHVLSLLAVLACMASGGRALAQDPPLAWTAGYRSFKLRPASGSNQVLDGFALGAQYRLDPAWSMDVALSRLTGTQPEAIGLRQVGLMAGPRYRWTLHEHWEGFARFQAGWVQLHASQGPASDQRSSLAFGPGAGIDYTVNPHLSLRAEGDFTFTHYAGTSQRSPGLFLGVVLRR